MTRISGSYCVDPILELFCFGAAFKTEIRQQVVDAPLVEKIIGELSRRTGTKACGRLQEHATFLC